MAYGDIIYGLLEYSADGQPQDEPQLEVPYLMKYLPEYYLGVPEMEQLQASAGAECGGLAYAMADSDGQKILESATWGLSRWEQMLALGTDTGKSYATRREMIKAKLRGSGTTTPEMIRRTASAFSGGDVEVAEVPDAYSFEVRFVGTLGIPANMAGLIQIMEEIKPAHLDYSFVYSYTWWDSLKQLTWNGARGGTWNELRVYE
ncbi:putative phage tail protein [Paenibacillus sp. MMS20-IR301]|uniref:putative phage tail protein n=1 Tax=Paenibacillus sp. MMS20-IR301 TaxID=2895946 RepID=UPI0028EEC961|nr:putative phage tail protein [Paenibacillus sp. MMS20-IR301]WNS42855.1 putative phage tail protein [Paenibacillus sp. MMS20-IR301]